MLKPSWFSATIPFNMARGTAGILTTLLALSLGASVTEIGLLSGANAIARIIFSMVWGKLSDSVGMRKSFLLIIFLALSPIFILLSLAQTIFQLILIYSLLAIFFSGFSPIAIMFAVESWQNKRWEGAVARYNSISRIGDILGLVMNAIITLHFKVNWLFYISSALCLIAFFCFGV